MLRKGAHRFPHIGSDLVAVLEYEHQPGVDAAVAVVPPLGVRPFAGGVEHGDVAAEAGGAVWPPRSLPGCVDGG